MHGMVKRDKFDLSPTSFWTACAVAAIGAFVMHKLGLPQKWHTAFVGTIAPFWYVTGVFRKRWMYPSFWQSLAVWFAVHLLLIWFVLSVVLRHVATVGMLLWIPIIMIEVIPLYLFIDVLEHKFRRQRNRSNATT